MRLEWEEIEYVDYKDLNFCPNNPNVNEFDIYKNDCFVVHQIKGFL